MQSYATPLPTERYFVSFLPSALSSFYAIIKCDTRFLDMWQVFPITLLHGKVNICKLFHMYSKLNRHKVNFISVYLSANPTAIKLFRCQNLEVIYK